MAINKIDILKFILLFFFLSRMIRLVMIKIVGSFVIGSVFIDVIIVLLFLAYIFYLFNSGKISFKVEGVGIVYCALLLLGLLQAIYFLTFMKGSGTELFLMAFVSFRKYFLPLLIFPLFNLLLEEGVRRDPSEVVAKILAFLKMLLFAALIYGFVEYILRTFVGGFNEVYTKTFISPLLNIDAESNSDVFMTMSELGRYYLWGYLHFMRVFGVCLDFHISGAVIFICYLFYALFSNEFRVFSWLNLFVFLAMIFTGSTQFSLPFIIFNLFYFVRYSKADQFLKASVGVLLAVAIMSLVLPAFTNFGITWDILLRILPSIIQNYDKFILGQGPVRMIAAGIAENLIKAENAGQAIFLQRITDFGVFTAMFEIGTVLFAGLLLFYWKAVFISKQGRDPDPAKAKIISNLRTMIFFCLLTFLGHYAILFDRTVSVFFMLLLSLVYLLQKTAPARNTVKKQGAA